MKQGELHTLKQKQCEQNKPMWCQAGVEMHTCPEADTLSIVGVCIRGRSRATSGVPGHVDGVMEPSIQLASVSGVMLPSVYGLSVKGVMVPSSPSWKDMENSSSAQSRSPSPLVPPSKEPSVMVLVALVKVSGCTLFLSKGRMSSSCTSRHCASIFSSSTCELFCAKLMASSLSSASSREGSPIEGGCAGKGLLGLLKAGGEGALY